MANENFTDSNIKFELDVKLTYDSVNKGYTGQLVKFPNIIVEGNTKEEVLDAISDSLELWLS